MTNGKHLCFLLTSCVQLDYIVKMKGPGTYGNLLNQQTANTQQMQAQRQQQQQQQRQQNTGLPGQENLSLHSNQQHALFRQLQNMQQQQQQMAQNGGVDQSQVPGTPNASSMMATPRPGSLSINGMQGAGTPNSQGTSSPVAMGTPSGTATSAVTAAMAFKKIEDMSDEKRNQFFRNVCTESGSCDSSSLTRVLQTPPIRRSYFTHIRGMPEETRRELFTRVCSQGYARGKGVHLASIETCNKGGISGVRSRNEYATTSSCASSSIPSKRQCS